MSEDLQGPLTRRVLLRIPHDRHMGLGLGQEELIARTGPTEGELLLDDSGRRSAVRVYGSPVTYELTLPVLPGWRPDPWWDIDPADPAAVGIALGRIRSDEWNTRYLLDGPPSAYDLVGRYWVLNEDGAFTEEDYKRAKGPYSATSPFTPPQWSPPEEQWLPFNFKQESSTGDPRIPDLKIRGDDGWSTRRRRFLDPLATHKTSPGSKVQVVIEVSFTGDDGPWHSGTGLVSIEGDRCAARFMTPDLCILAAVEGNFVEAYIRGLLRVWITARIEGDDVAFAVAREEGNLVWPLPWTEVLDRAGSIRHDRRELIHNDLWNEYGFTSPPDVDERADCAILAQRILDEAGVRRCPGSVAFPHLLRPSDFSPYDNYKVGDELNSIETDDPATSIALSSGGPAAIRGPRVAGVTYRWAKAPPETSMQLTLEDKTYDAENFIAGRG